MVNEGKLSMQFEPFVFIKSKELKPSSISAAAWGANQFKYINLPADTTEADLPKVQEIVRNSFQQEKGNCVGYGPVTGYAFVFAADEALVLDVDGEVLHRSHGQFWPQSISIQERL